MTRPAPGAGRNGGTGTASSEEDGPPLRIDREVFETLSLRSETSRDGDEPRILRWLGAWASRE